MCALGYQSVTVFEPPKKAATATVVSGDHAKLFEAGVRLLKKPDRIEDAVMAFAQAYKLQPSEPRYASYYGLSLAMAGRRVIEAEALCARASEKGFYSAELFFNLGRVRLIRRNKRGAIAAFNKGLSIDANHPDIADELSKMGSRRPPVFSFLKRGHPINRCAGIVLSRIRSRRAPRAEEE